MKATAFLILSGLCGLAACGTGPSGVKADKAWDELSDKEIETFCEWGVDVQGGEGFEVECGESLSVIVPTLDECIEEASYLGGCELLVSDVEACYEAMGADLCSLGGDACTPIFDCIFNGAR